MTGINKNKAPAKTKNNKKSASQSQKTFFIKSRGNNRASTATASSRAQSRQATVEPSEDDDDNEPDHVGGTLDANGDIIMEEVNSLDKSDSGVEDSEDKESEISNLNSSSYLVSRRTNCE